MTDMTTKTCYVFGAGERAGKAPVLSSGDLLIAADGGYDTLMDMGLMPHVAIGDFDSVTIAPQGEQVIRLPREKDETDMLAALRVGLERGYDRFVIYGGTGGRFDHTLANLQCLAYLALRGALGHLMESSGVVTCIPAGVLTFEKTAPGQLVSVFPYGGEAVIDERGLKYPLHEKLLTPEYPLGVSNEFLDEASYIVVHSGLLLVVFPESVVPQFTPAAGPQSAPPPA